jgi:hypothetical protein
MIRLRTYVARHPIAAYLALTFGISWGGALVAVAASPGCAEPRRPAIRDFRMR